MTDKHSAADEVAALLRAARVQLDAASALAAQHGMKGYASKIDKEIERVKAIEWPLLGRHPDDAPPART